ncbi:MAG: ornithine cyclodeaminase [Tissierellia bacterium]|nr:ornithine cyclodeaminase [Tissierellia bacterium]
MTDLKTLKLIDLEEMSSYIKKVGVENLIEKLIPYLESDYRDWEKFTKMPRPTHHSEVGVNELMLIGNRENYSVKYVNGHPINPSRNLLTVIGMGLFADVETGYPKMICEMTLLTAIRTAATSVMAAKYLARANSKKMALIGNGCQSEFQAIGFHKVLGIEEINVFDIDEAATDKLIDNLSRFKDLKVNKCTGVAEACEGVDIVTTVTADKKFATILTKNMIEEGMHLNCVGGDCPGKTELDSQILYMGDVYVELEEQSRIEGEIQHMPDDFEVTEITNVIKTKKPIDRKDSDITIFDSVGFAIEDYSILRMIYEIAKEEDLGKEISMVPVLDDPKNLYGLIK